MGYNVQTAVAPTSQSNVNKVTVGANKKICQMPNTKGDRGSDRVVRQAMKTLPV